MSINIIADPLFQSFRPLGVFLPWRPTLLWHWHVKARVTDWPEPVPDAFRGVLGNAVVLNPGWGGIYQWIGFAGERRDLHFAIRADVGVPVSVRICIEYMDLATNTSRRVDHLKSRADVMWLGEAAPGFGWIDVPIERAPDAYIGGITVTNAAAAEEGGVPVHVGRFDLLAETVDRHDIGCRVCRPHRAARSRSLEVDKEPLQPDYSGLIWESPAPADKLFTQRANSDWLQSIDHEVDSLSHRVERLEKLLAKRKGVEPA